MGELIDFGEAKKKILGKGTEDETARVSPSLSNALEEFSFSRLSKFERIQRVLADAVVAAAPFHFDPESLGEAVRTMALRIEPQLPNDAFSKPPAKA